MYREPRRGALFLAILWRGATAAAAAAAAAAASVAEIQPLQTLRESCQLSPRTARGGSIYEEAAGERVTL